MSDVTLMLPWSLNSGTLGEVASGFLDACGGHIPSKVIIDFGRLNWVEPVGVTFLSNLVHWLARSGSNAYFSNHQRSGQAIEFLDDSLFFQQHTGTKVRLQASPRSTTIPLQLVAHERSHDWMRTSLIPFLSSSTGINEASLRPLQVSMSELFNNIQDHAEQNVGSVFIQHFPKKRCVTISMADFGRGIPAAVGSVRRGLTDNQAIELAVQRDFSSKSTPRNRGAGLDILLQTAVVQNGGTVRIFSLNGYVVFTSERQGVTATPIEGRGFCPGTTVDISLRTDRIVHVEDEPEDMEW